MTSLMAAFSSARSVYNGSYSFEGNTLVMTDDDKRRTIAQFRLEQQSRDFGRTWTDTLCLLSPGSSGEVCYNRDR